MSSSFLRDRLTLFVVHRLALPLRSAHGCRVTVHHGFLCASFVSSCLKLIVFLLRQIIMFSDLECDYINPIDLCNKLNQVRLTLCLLFILLTCDGGPRRVLALVCHSRKLCPCLFDDTVPGLWSMDCIPSQRTVTCFQCQQVRRNISRVSCLDLIPFTPTRIRNKNHMYDATEIFRTLSGHKKESFIKLGFYLLSFFYYLYRYVTFNFFSGDLTCSSFRMIVALISESE